MLVPSRWQRALRWLRWLEPQRFTAPPDAPRPFVVLTSPRSGSTWLVDLLNSHPDIVCFSEIFAHDHFGNMPHGGAQHAMTWDSYSVLKLPGRGRRQRLDLYFQYLDEEIYTQRHGAAHIGFKLMYFQLERGFGIPAYLHARRVSVLHLLRLNHLDVLLSEEARKLRKFYHAPAGSDVPPVRVTLEPTTLVYRLEQRDQQLATARQQVHKLFHSQEVIYEDLMAGRQRLEEVLSFLGATPQITLQSDFQKLSPGDHRTTIANYDAVAEALGGSRFASLLR